MTKLTNIMSYINYGDKKMKKVIPYVLAILLGYFVANIVFDYQNSKLVGFQLGVYNSLSLAKEYNKKYPSSIIIKDDDVYRLFYSVLSNDKVIEKMEDYLNQEKIAFYKKEIMVKDNGLIKALSKYETSMLDVSNDSFKAINIIAAIELGKRVSNLVINEKILVNESAKVNKYFSNQISNEKQENLLVILVNNSKRLIGYKKMFVGTDNASLVSIKEILNYAIRERASGIIIMHNHPSGNLIPSNADNELTSNLSNACKLVGIPLLDHIITAGANYYSYLEGKVIYEK